MMKNKKFALTFFALFAFAILSGFASAGLTMDIISQPPILEHDDGSFDIRVNITYSGGDSASVNFTLDMTEGIATIVPQNIVLQKNQPRIITLDINFPTHQSGNLAGDITARANDSSSAQVSFSIQIEDSPGLDVTLVRQITENQDGIIRVRNTGNINFNDVVLSSTGDFEVEFSNENFELEADRSMDITVSPLDLGEIGFEGKSITVKAEAEGGTSDTLVMTVSGSFCQFGEIGTNNMSISIDNIDNEGDSEDSEEDVWVLGDVIEIEVDVDNLMRDDDLKDIIVQLGFFDSEGNDVADDLDFESGDEEIDVGRINEDETETVVFRFRVSPNMDVGDYRLVVKAYDDGDEDLLCVSEENSETIDVRLESEEERFIIVDDILIDNANQLVCGDFVSGQFDVFNIGEDDQDRVRIVMRNDDLGIDQQFELTNFDEGESDTIDFTFTLPENIDAGMYRLRFYTEYEYDNGVYEIRSDRTWEEPMNVISCAGSGSTGGKASIIASLVSDAIAGDEMIVEATITNIGTQESEFRVNALGFQSWAELESISSEVFTLDAGESKDITITLNVDEDASGTQTFTIQTISGETVDSREIEVNFPEENKGFTGFSIEGLTGSGYVWLLVLVNVVLIVLIILVAVRLSRR